MYLYLRKSNFISSFETPDKVKYPKDIEVLKEGVHMPHMIKEEMYQVGYWRKANQIHNFFVQKCADGIDHCQTIYVYPEKLRELLNLCKQVLDDHSKAKELLPTTSGFFFGSTEYDEYYFEDIEYTIKLLEPIVAKVEEFEEAWKVYDSASKAKKPPLYDIIYEASW